MGTKKQFSGICFISLVAVLILLPINVGWLSKSRAVEVEEYSDLQVGSESITVKLHPPGRQSGILEAELRDLEGNLLAKVTRRHKGKPVSVRFYAVIEEKQLENYYLSYRFRTGEPFRKRSIFFMREIIETTVLGQRELVAGTEPMLRIMVRDRAVGEPISGAEVTVEVRHQDAIICRYEDKTNVRGEVSARLKLPDKVLRGARLKIEVKTENSQDTVEETIHIKSATRTLLTTDKPLYQPGQTIHIRSLSLAQSNMKPRADAKVVFEVEDSKGNKVFKARNKTDKFGISHADFVLADELNKGTYRIRAIVAGAREEKTVTVERYVLPKFKIKVETDRKFYQPGETVKGELQVDYFFGKPVAGGKVKIKSSKFDVAYVDFKEIEGKTDPSGHYAFEVRLPDHFVGQPLEAGKASVKFDVSVVDTADHKEKVTRNVPVTAAPILIAAVPEGGELIANLKNRIYIVTTYADSTAAACRVVWDNGSGKKKKMKTDKAGFGVITVTPQEGKPISLTLKAKDKKGHVGRAKVELKPKQQEDDDSILVRTNKSLYKVGDKVKFSITATRKTGTVYVDVIKNRQTYLTRTLELTKGKASLKITLPALLAGTVQINAYLIGANGVTVRDRRLILVDPANDLRISVVGEKESYLPGTEARLTFKVTDKRGRGVPSALGLMVVDEAVFALQEMQPGLEKVYYYLEKEIATPRYEIHGYELDNCFPKPGPEPDVQPIPAVRRDNAAKVMLASAKGVGEYSLRVNTYHRDGKDNVFYEKMARKMMPSYQSIYKAVRKFHQKYRRDDKISATKVGFGILIEKGYLQKEDVLDPWGNRMKMDGGGRDWRNYRGFVIASPGIDGKWDTVDDVSIPLGWRKEDGLWGRRRGRFWRGKEKNLRFRMNINGVEMMESGGMGEAMGGMQAMEVEVLKESAKMPSSSVPGGGGAEPIRIRQYFPETLYFNPAVITDERGRAVLDIPLADSITTWRMTSMASSAAGQLGSSTAGIRVFQEFFVDIDFPVALTQNDEVHVPVAIFNYLKKEQKIQLQVQKEDWFELKGLAEKTVTLGPGEVRAVYFPMVAKKIGFRKFTVLARGSSKSDAVARRVEIVPDGKEFLISESGHLKDTIRHTISIPKKAIDDASKIFVKVYPGVLSQVVEGLDKMLRMPFGCFEQTSSVTYPNILVLDYMKTSGKITPEIQMKAEGFINAGYQRLVSFEVPGGGFEWFGKAPAHRILTAYGLMEFYDMSKVYEVDPAIIHRTQRWLAEGQEKDGSYKPSKGGIREGAINKFTDDVFRNTAYITWALAATGYEGPEVGKGVEYIRKHLDDMKDNYTIALTANALAVVDPEDETTLNVLRVLKDRRTQEGELVYWKAQSETPTHGKGKSADIEVTALAVQAFIRCGRELGTVGKAVTYLVKNKDAYGTWQSTQATIQALRAMLMAERGATAKTDATIKLAVNGEAVKQLKVDQFNSDVLQLVDVKEYTRKGDNSVSLAFEGKGSLLYQIVGRYYMPYPRRGISKPVEPMSIRVDYDRTQLVTEDIINVTATVTNQRPGKVKMVIVDLGLPPGFTLIADKLNRLVEKEAIEKYTVTGRQIIVYLREVDRDKPVRIEYQLLAKYPLKAKTPKSVVYEYYDPDIRSEAKPIQLKVSKGDGR